MIKICLRFPSFTDELTQSLSLWQKSRFVTSRHYKGVPLEHMLESKRVRPRLCAAIAVDILKPLAILHENGLFQEDFALDDLCLTKDTQVRITYFANSQLYLCTIPQIVYDSDVRYIQNTILLSK